MPDRIDLKRLTDFFPADDIEWKPIATTRDGKRALAAAYLTNRAIMDRLDEVCGPENWQNEYREGPDGGVLCGLSIRVGDEWITKWDGASNTDIHPVKGGLSTSMRRAAVQWGLGRSLYRFSGLWVEVDERGRFRETPSMPKDMLPPADRQAPSSAASSASPSAASTRRAGTGRAAGKASRNGSSTGRSSRGRRARTDVEDYRPG